MDGLAGQVGIIASISIEWVRASISAGRVHFTKCLYLVGCIVVKKLEQFMGLG